ncbi:hypothetical protein V5O48_017451, partial [Marasmius crinis-equi]
MSSFKEKEDSEKGSGENASYAEIEIDTEAEKRLVRRLDLRIVPASMTIYLLCFLDRSNIGNAKLLNADVGDSLQQTAHTSNSQFNTALMIFLVAYILFET